MDVNHQRQGHTQVKAPDKKVYRLRRESLLGGQEKSPHFLVVTTVSGGSGPLPHGLFEFCFIMTWRVNVSLHLSSERSRTEP